VLGDLLQRAGLAGQAQQAWQQAAQRLQTSAAQTEPQALLLAARLAWRRGDAQEARSGAEKLASTPYRHPDMLLLQQELSQGPPVPRPTQRGSR
ncbi:MAG: hypothetical protein WAQ05_18315, partial [Rubrivivax sp.]